MDTLLERHTTLSLSLSFLKTHSELMNPSSPPLLLSHPCPLILGEHLTVGFRGRYEVMSTSPLLNLHMCICMGKKYYNLDMPTPAHMLT